MANKAELQKRVHELNKEQNLPVNKGETEKIIENVLDAIIALTNEEGKLQLIGFGAFEIRERAARKGRNPQNGDEIDIAASRGVGFKPGKIFKDSVK